MKIPSSIKIGGFTYKVLKDYKFNQANEYAGQADHDLLEMRLSNSNPSGMKRSREKYEETFVHELLHCVDVVFNDGQLKEEQVSRLSNGLYQVLSQIT